VPKYHKIAADTNPISPGELRDRYSPYEDVAVTEITVDRRKGIVYFTIDTKDGEDKEFEDIVALVRRVDLVPYVVGPINLDGEEEAAV
jgi:hypothetical protein